MRQRPPVFSLNPRHPLYKRLAFAGLGGGHCPQTNRYFNSAPIGGSGELVNMDPLQNWVWSSELGRWAVRFNAASNTSITVPRYRIVGYGEPLVLGCWMRSTQRASYIGLMSQTINGGWQPDFILENNNCKLLGWFSNTIVVSTTTIADGQWHHVLMQRIGETGYIYVDGDKEIKSISGGRVPTGFTCSNTCLGWWGRTDFDFDGEMADPMVFDRALSLSEIQLLADRSDPMLGGLILPPKRVSFAAAYVPRRHVRWRASQRAQLIGSGL